MPSYQVIVQHRDGTPAKSKRVVLGTPGGNTSPSFTDAYGVAVLSTHDAQTATIYVSGKALGKIRCGKSVVTLP